MMVRSPEAARVAEAIRTVMKDQALSRAELADRIEASTGTRPGRQWIHRTLSGGAHLTVLKPTTEPNDMLKTIARAIDPENAELLADQFASHAAAAAATWNMAEAAARDAARAAVWDAERKEF